MVCLARADAPNLFESGKMSTESLALGIETCASKVKGDKRESLITRHYCACMMDASQTLSQRDKLSKEHAHACLSDATQAVDGYLRGQADRKEQNLFDGTSLPASSIYTMYLVCLKRKPGKTRFCGCLVDGVRTDPSFSAEDFIAAKRLLKREWVSTCGDDPRSADPTRNKR